MNATGAVHINEKTPIDHNSYWQDAIQIRAPSQECFQFSSLQIQVNPLDSTKRTNNDCT